MTSSEIARDLGTIVAVLGVLAFLLPPPERVPRAAQRAAGLGLMGIV